MAIKQIVAAGCILAVAAACTQNNSRYGHSHGGGIDKQTVGTLGGAVVGGVLGSKIGGGTGQGIAIGVGTLLGAALGSQIGESLDRADMAYYNSASQRALETGQPGQTMPWNNPSSSAQGTITPQNYYQIADGSYCREYSQTISVGGTTQQGYGTACRQPDGSWKIIE